MNDCLQLQIYSAGDVKKMLGEKAKSLRLISGLKRTTLSERSGVSVGSIVRFESTGDVSLDSMLKIARTLACMDAFLSLFPTPSAMSISDLVKQEKKSTAKRGKI